MWPFIHKPRRIGAQPDPATRSEVATIDLIVLRYMRAAGRSRSIHDVATACAVTPLRAWSSLRRLERNGKVRPVLTDYEAL